MREVKFRVWDKVAKKLGIIESIDWCGEKEVTYHLPHYEYKDQCECQSLENIILMQYTGLKDKSGVEIYEDDILETSDGEIFVVEYGLQEIDAFYIPGWNIVSSEKQNDFKVIGNIYENPNLLTK